jgi:MFS family permease
MVIAVASVPTMLIFFPRLVVKIGLLETGSIGSFLFGLGILLLPFTTNITTFSLLLPVIGIANGFQMNVSTMALSESAPPSRVASTLAVKQTFDALAQTFGKIDQFMQPLCLFFVNVISSRLCLFFVQIPFPHAPFFLSIVSSIPCHI